MKLGFITTVLNNYSFKEVIDIASEIGYECVEVACWPLEMAKSNNVTHINIEDLEPLKIATILDYCKSKNVAISALAYYSNPLDPDLQKRANTISHIQKIIQLAPKLGVYTFTTFIGKDRNKPLEENLEMYKEVWTPIVKFAESYGVRIAIENCPMLMTKEQWPGGLNLATTPTIWRQMFELIPSAYLGLNYDPAHLVWQHIDYIRPLYEFREKIFHVHIKDIKIDYNKLADVGVMAYPIEYITPKLPGLGDIDWGKYISALMDINYNGYICNEIKDNAFKGSAEAVRKSLELSYRYMRTYVN